MDRLSGYSWPGNVRELQNALRQYVTLGRLDLSVPASVRVESASAPVPSPGEDGDLQDLIQAYEKKIISLALQRHRWHRARAAESLGINRRTLFKKMKQYAFD